jgi:4,5-DOPA dioxygenase extradiol
MMGKTPTLFVGHGSPMNAIEDNAFTRVWREIATRIGKPKAILCVSAHWQTQGAGVTSATKPETIHDFQGFPAPLAAFEYPARGDPQLAAQVAALLPLARVRHNATRGLDHGAWSVLAQMYPQADVPVVQLSMDATQKPSFHYNVGRQLAPLRDAGVLVIGSGNIVHNLGLMNPREIRAPQWANHANEVVKNRIETRDHRALIAFSTLDADMALAVPSAEHFLPLLYVLGLQGPDEPATFFNDKIVMGSISMTSVAIGT